MSTEAVRIVGELQSVLAGKDIVAALGNADEDRRVRDVLATLATPDFEVLMIGPEYLPTQQQRSGPDGFAEVWDDWTSPFDEFRIEIDEVIDAGSGRVVTMVRQIGKTKTGGVEVETAAAAVWTIRNRKLARVEFHLDRDSALRAAGLDPRSSSEGL
jgi:ketosteroid isomerase-like protein